MGKIFTKEEMKETIDKMCKEAEEELYFVVGSMGSTSISNPDSDIYKKIRTTIEFPKIGFKKENGISDLESSNVFIFGTIGIEKSKLNEKILEKIKNGGKDDGN